MPNYNMRGVQFFTDNLGNKTAAIVDLKEHSDFWAEVLAECGEPIDFQFLVDSQGEKIAVCSTSRNTANFGRMFMMGSWPKG